MDEEKLNSIQDSNENCSSSVLKINDSQISAHKDGNLVTSESILSRINEECNKISSAEHEDEEKIDSKLSSDSEGNSIDVAENLSSDCNGKAEAEIQPESNNENTDILSSAPDLECSDNDRSVELDVNVDATSTEETDALRTSDIEKEHLSNSENENAFSGMEKNSVTSICIVETLESKEDQTTNINDKKDLDLENKTSGDTISSEEMSESNLNDTKTDDNVGLENDKNESGKVKIKLRSFASLCENEIKSSDNSNSSGIYQPNETNNFEVSGVAVGDIVQHSNYVESDESGVMHLKISNVVGGEDCITGLSVDDSGDSLANIQISSITSLIEPVSPDERINKMNVSTAPQEIGGNEVSEAEVNTIQKVSSALDETTLLNKNENSDEFKESSTETVVNIFKSPLMVAHPCANCKKKLVCEFRVVYREKSDSRITFLCSIKCKENTINNLPDNHIQQKPRLFFERVCGMCGRDISALSKSKILSWQTREFCDKLCLADHIGEVARTCFFCQANVRVLYMVKYCVRFGSDVHQFCSNTCLETFKTKIKVCSFCQKNLSFVNKVISPSNKEYCSDKCLKRAQRRDIGQINYKEENDCTVCLKKVVNEYEFIYKNAPTFLCSTPCLNVFKYVNQVKSVNCCLCCRLLNAEDTATFFFNGKQLRVFCSESCFSVFVISSRKIVTCHYCKVKKYNFDMIWSLTEDAEDYFCCSVCCLNLVENQNKSASNQTTTSALADSKAVVQAESASEQTSNEVQNTTCTPTGASTPSTPLLKNCNMCTKLEPAQFHMVMSDSTLRSFCSYVCATRYKCTFGFQVSGGGSMVDSKEEVMKQVTAQGNNTSEQANKPMVSVPGNKLTPKFDLKDAKTLMRLFCPPHLSNKSTMCRPVQNTKGIQCKPHQWHKTSQTENEALVSDAKAIIPVPFPIYMPTPLMMYSASTPVPLIIPVPVPIPVFIPTLENTTKDLEKVIKSILGKKYDEDNSGLNTPKESSVKTEERKNITQFETKDTEVKEILKMEHNLQKYIISSQNVNPSKCELRSQKRKLYADSYTLSPKRRKLDEDEADNENEEVEELNLMFGLCVWQSWVQRKTIEDAERNHCLQEDLYLMTSEVLGQSLILFLKDLSKQTTRFDADTIFYIMLGLQKYLFEKGSSHCIFLELKFDAFTSVLDEMIENFFQALAQPCTKLLTGTRVTEEMLWEARQLGAHTPHVLINTLFYFNTKIFKLKNSSEHVKLTFGQISKEAKRTSHSPDGSPILTTYLKYCKEPNSKEDGAIESILKMFENKENPLRCPVKLYEFYLSKCTYSLQNDKDTYYVFPEESCAPDSVVWYSAKPIDVGTINKMLNRVLLVKEVQESLLES